MRKLIRKEQLTGLDYFGALLILDSITNKGRGYLITRESWKDEETGDYVKALKRVPAKRKLIPFLNRDVRFFCKNHLKTKEKLAIVPAHIMLISNEMYGNVVYYHPELNKDSITETDWLILASPRLLKKMERKLKDVDSYTAFSYSMAKLRANDINKKREEEKTQEDNKDVTE